MVPKPKKTCWSRRLGDASEFDSESDSESDTGEQSRLEPSPDESQEPPSLLGPLLGHVTKDNPSWKPVQDKSTSAVNLGRVIHARCKIGQDNTASTTPLSGRKKRVTAVVDKEKETSHAGLRLLV